MGKILIVDDQELNREILKEMLDGNGYTTLEAENGEQAIDIIRQNEKDILIVLLDLVMPVMNGFDVLTFMNEHQYIKNIPVILITGDEDKKNVAKAYNLGVSDVIHKPFEINIVKRRTENVIELYLEKNNMERELKRRTDALIESQKKLRKQNEFLVNALSSVVEFRNLESGEHIQRVREFSKIVLKHLMEKYPKYGLTEEDADYIASASVLHDLGKIAIPDSILLKPGKLSPEEFEIIKKHTIYGCELLERFRQEENKLYDYSYQICRYHHERYDGKGYPDGLTGDDIPIAAQIISIVDVFDALVSKRVYKGSYSTDIAFCMIMNGECGCFGPDIIDCLKASRDEMFELASTLREKDCSKEAI